MKIVLFLLMMLFCGVSNAAYQMNPYTGRLDNTGPFTVSGMNTISGESTIYFNGNVGIGTSSPSSKLMISSDDSASSGFSYLTYSDWEANVNQTGWSTSILGYRKNTGSVTPDSGYHNIGAMGWYEDTADGKSDGYGTEGRTDGHGATPSYVGLMSIAKWQDADSGNATSYSGTVYGVSATRSILNYDGTARTGASAGLSIGLFAPDSIGGYVNYGLYVAPQTGATANYGAVIGTANYKTLVIGADADNTTANAGMYFGASGDTSLYRSATNTLTLGNTLIVDGNIGIGTESPTNKLEVVGNIYSTGSLTMAGSGNVGIGTTTASQTLTVSGSFTVSGNSTLTGNMTTAGTFTSSNASTLGWMPVTVTASTGIASCTSACVFCFSSATTLPVGCSDTITGACICAGAN